MSEEKKSDILEKIDQIDRRVLYWILTAIIIFCLLFPIGLPLEVTSRTRDFYKVLQELPEGSNVVLSIDATIETWPENGPGAIAITKYIASKKLKTVIWGYVPESSLLTEKYIVPIFKEAGLKYGTDYVFIGFFPGQETTIARLATDIQGVIKKDFYGTPIEQLPMMKGIKDAKDISLLICIDGTNSTEFYVRHWKPVGVPVISTVVGVIISGYMPFLESGQLSAMLMGSKGNAEFEKLSGKLGKGVGMMDMLSIAHAVLIILIIMGNIGYILRKMRRRG